MPEEHLSAQVILRPVLGAEGQPATADTVARLLPAPASVELARSFFQARGFEVSPAFGMSFSITGPAAAFEAIFGRRVRLEDGGVTVDGGAELPLDRVPAEIAGVVQAIAFPPPPDFGPTRF